MKKDSGKKKSSRSSRSESPKGKGERQASGKKEVHWRTVASSRSKSSSPAKAHASRKSTTQKQVSKAGESSKSGSSNAREESSSLSSNRSKGHKYRRHLHQELQDSATEYPKYPYSSKPRTTDKGVSTPAAFKAIKNVRIGTTDDLFWNSPPPPYGWGVPSHINVSYSNDGRSRSTQQESLRSSSSIRSPMDEFRRRDETFSSINENEVWSPPPSESSLTVSSEPKTNSCPPGSEPATPSPHRPKIIVARTLSLPTMIRLADQNFPEAFAYQRGNCNGSRSWWSSNKVLALGLTCGFLYMIAMMSLALMMIMSDDDKASQSKEKQYDAKQPNARSQSVPRNSGTDPPNHNASTVAPSLRNGVGPKVNDVQ